MYWKTSTPTRDHLGDGVALSIILSMSTVSLTTALGICMPEAGFRLLV